MAEAGCKLDDVVKTTVFIKDMNEFAAMNKVYAEYFVQDCPARACFEVARLPKDALVEIEAIATCRLKSLQTERFKGKNWMVWERSFL